MSLKGTPKLVGKETVREYGWANSVSYTATVVGAGLGRYTFTRERTKRTNLVYTYAADCDSPNDTLGTLSVAATFTRRSVTEKDPSYYQCIETYESFGTWATPA